MMVNTNDSKLGFVDRPAHKQLGWNADILEPLPKHLLVIADEDPE